MARKVRFEGMTLDGTTLKKGFTERYDVTGASARVESAGQIRTRTSVTRTALSLGVGLLFKKKVDERELYLTVEGPSVALAVEVDPKKGADARKFAVAINAAGRLPAPTQPPPMPPATAPAPVPPAGWYPDHSGQTRWWDGNAWS